MQYRSVQKENATVATGAFSMSVDFIGQVLWVGVTTDAAPTTSENIIVSLDSSAGSGYDHVLFTSNPSTGSDTDTTWGPEYNLVVGEGDKLSVTFANTDNNDVKVSVYYLPF